MNDLGMNERAWRLADEYVERAAELRLHVCALTNGARVIDAGVGVPGGLEAGRMLALLCMGGLGHVDFTTIAIGDRAWPAVAVRTDHPAIACMASQYAGWAIAPDGYFAMGSGPLRARAAVEKELFGKITYREHGSRGVLVLEGRTPPTADVADWVARKAGIDATGLTLAIAPTASLAGSVQIVARIVETGLHKLETLGFDVATVVAASGVAPVPPVANNDGRAIGRTNDCVLYGGTAWYTVDATDEQLAALVERLPASASADYGTPFYETLKRYDNDFYKIDPLLFSPAEVWLTSTRSGNSFHAGSTNPQVLEASLGL